MKRDKKINIVAILGLMAMNTSVLAGTPAPANPTSSNLIQVYRQALQFNPNYLKQQDSAHADEEDVTIKRAGLLPQLDMGIGANYPEGVQNPSIGVNQALINFSATNQLSIAKTQAIIGQLTIIQQRQKLLMDVVKDYFNLAQKQAKRQLDLQSEKDSQKLLAEAKIKFDVGQVQRTDVSTAEVAYADAQSGIITDRTDIANAQSVLQKISGFRNSSVAELNTPAKMPSEPWLSIPIPNRVYWLNTARTRNIDLRIQQLEINKAQAAVKGSKLSRLPTVSATADYTPSLIKNANPALTGNPNLTRDSSLSVGVALDFKLNMGEGAQVRKSYYQYLAAQQTFRDTAQTTYDNINQAYNNVIQGQKAIAMKKKVLAIKKQALDDAQISYSAGFLSATDVVSKQQDFYTAKIAYSKAVYGYLTNIFTLKQTAGVLDNRDLELMNHWLG